MPVKGKRAAYINLAKIIHAVQTKTILRIIDDSVVEFLAKIDRAIHEFSNDGMLLTMKNEILRGMKYNWEERQF